jgi:hypothetical protein
LLDAQDHEDPEDAEDHAAGEHVGEETNGKRERAQEVPDDLEDEDERPERVAFRPVAISRIPDSG